MSTTVTVSLPVSGDSIVIRQRVSNRERKDYMTKMENAPTRDTIIKEPVMSADGNPALDASGNPIMAERVVRGATYAGALDSFDMLLGFVIESWTLTDDDDKPVPVPKESGTLDALDELDVEDYDALQAAVEPTIKRMFPQFAADENTVKDPTSPSEPSSESAHGSTANR